ncbi:MAG: hypothetical protein ABIS50_22475 [Luteolibacter sp.]|uniref:type II secretion system protein GspD n=1 Tax=Luteolibacter sp. TaxID=1962973 RepID=UPI003267C80F
MRLFLTLLVILGLLAFFARSCSDRLTGGPSIRKSETVKPQAGPSSPVAVSNGVVAVPGAVPPPAVVPGFPPVEAAPAVPLVPVPPVIPPLVVIASGIYEFKHREPPEFSSMPALQSLGAQVISDKATRCVFVRAPQDALGMILSFLESIDLVGGSCAVQTWAVYVDRSATKGFDLVAALNAVVPSVAGVSLGNGAFTMNATSGDIAAALNVIADGSSVEVLQRPHVRLAHGVISRIESTQEVPIPQTTLSNGIAQTSIEYRKVGLQLQVTPYFMSNNQVRLEVQQTNGLIGNTVEIEGNQIPVIQSQSVQTTAEMTVGQTIVLGGVSTQRSKVVRGLLRHVTEITEGALYVILSTYEDIPKAVPVGSPLVEAPDGFPVPLTTPRQNPADWIDGQLLPVKGWQEEERHFIRSHGYK